MRVASSSRCCAMWLESVRVGGYVEETDKRRMLEHGACERPLSVYFSAVNLLDLVRVATIFMEVCYIATGTLPFVCSFAKLESEDVLPFPVERNGDSGG